MAADPQAATLLDNCAFGSKHGGLQHAQELAGLLGLARGGISVSAPAHAAGVGEECAVEQPVAQRDIATQAAPDAAAASGLQSASLTTLRVSLVEAFFLAYVMDALQVFCRRDNTSPITPLNHEVGCFAMQVPA